MDFDFTTDSIITNVATSTLNLSSSTGGLQLPVGTTAQRNGSPINGTIRYNSTLSALDAYVNNGWTSTVMSVTPNCTITEDLFANRPTAGTANRLFVATDTKAIYRDSGTTWDLIGTGTSASPGGSNTNVQFNDNGSFGGVSNFIYDKTINRVDLSGSPQTTLLTIGGTTQVGNSQLYIEVNGDTTYEGMRTYFKRSTAGISGWITYHYDQNRPNIRITDEDDDPTYILFQTIGTGTYASPQYSNYFGSRGAIAGIQNGFSWQILGTECMSLDSQWLKLPTGTVAQRVTATDSMIRYNSDDDVVEIGTAPYTTTPSYAGLQRSIINRKRPMWVDEFMAGSAGATGTAQFGDLGWTVSSLAGTNSNSIITSIVDHPGILQLGTGATNGNGNAIYLGSAVSSNIIIGNQVEYFSFLVRIPTITNISTLIGLQQSVGTALGGTASVIFSFNTGSNAAWQFITRSSSTSTTITTTTTVVANTWYLLEAFYDGTTWTPVVNGTVNTGSTTNIPTVALNVGVSVSTSNASAKQLQLDYFSMYTRELGQRY